MRAFVTVGSTKFDDLIKVVTSEDFLTSLSSNGYTHLVVQYGNSKLRQGFKNESSHGVKVTAWQFKPDLNKEYLVADLIISHAGLHSACAQSNLLTAHHKVLGPFWKC